MSRETSEVKQRTKNMGGNRDRDQALYNVVDNDGRWKKNPNDEEEEMNAFASWSKKYYHISKEIRKNTLEQEKKELEDLRKSPIVKYFEGSRYERIAALEEEKKLLDQMDALSKAKENKNFTSSTSERFNSNNAPTQGEKQEFEALRKKYHNVSKDIRKNAIEKEEQELKNQQDSASSSRYFDGNKEDRLKTLEEEKNLIKNMETLQKAKK